MVNFDLAFRIIDGIIEIMIFCVSIYCLIMVVKQLKKKRSKGLFYLLILFSMTALTAISFCCDGFLNNGILNLYEIQYGYAISLVSTAIANIALLFFAIEVFYNHDDVTPLKINIVKIAFSLGELSMTIIAAFLKLASRNVLIFIAIHMVFALLMNLILGINSYKLAKRLTEENFKKSVRNIGNFALCMNVIYIFLILDSNPEGLYTIWSVIGLGIFLLTVFFAYKAFVVPINESKNGKD